MISEDLFQPKPAKTKRLNILPSHSDQTAKGRFPKWLHRKLFKGSNLFKTNTIVEKYKLNTVCEEAKCPNRLECYTNKTATFLALGKECTRNCGFCDIDFSKTPKPLEADEPERIALSVKELGLKHAVITMVARDDLFDKGASQIACIVKSIRKHAPHTTIELLTSDFSGQKESLDIILETQPEIFNHNIETVKALSPRVRHKATYERTLEMLSYVKKSQKTEFVKSGLMVGLGEKKQQVYDTLQDLYEAGCDIVTLGQYLQASKNKLRVKEFVTPEQFSDYADYGKSLGLCFVYAGPLVRSSFNAGLIKELASKRS